MDLGCWIFFHDRRACVLGEKIERSKKKDETIS
jgi:hypothetical protein